eukprot:COSAG03_NODE_193_length_10859_cov_5.565771_12_plen_87_part_01
MLDTSKRDDGSRRHLPASSVHSYRVNYISTIIRRIRYELRLSTGILITRDILYSMISIIHRSRIIAWVGPWRLCRYNTYRAAKAPPR